MKSIASSWKFNLAGRIRPAAIGRLIIRADGIEVNT